MKISFLMQNNPNNCFFSIPQTQDNFIVHFPCVKQGFENVCVFDKCPLTPWFKFFTSAEQNGIIISPRQTGNTFKWWAALFISVLWKLHFWKNYLSWVVPEKGLGLPDCLIFQNQISPEWLVHFLWFFQCCFNMIKNINSVNDVSCAHGSTSGLRTTQKWLKNEVFRTLAKI